MPDWHTETNAILSPQISAATVQWRVCAATGQVFVRGSVTFNNNAGPGPEGLWLKVKLLSMFSGYRPQSPEYFTGTIRYEQLNGQYWLSSQQKDYITTIGFSVDTNGILNIGAIRTAISNGIYTVNFNGYYFYE
jgi:hypothetical protein